MYIYALILLGLAWASFARRVQHKLEQGYNASTDLDMLGELLLASSPSIARTRQRVAVHSARALPPKSAVATSVVEATQVGTEKAVTDEMDGPLRKITLRNADGATATIYALGATVTSFKAPTEVFALRPDATFDGSKPIPGGMPHCWPWFGLPATAQRHGFARNVEWEVASVKGGASPSVTFTLEQSDYTKQMWPNSFKNTYTVTLGADNSLTSELDVSNTGSTAWDFSSGMHTYFAVGDIDATSIEGAFEGSTWRDRTLDEEGASTRSPPETENRKELTIASHTDRLYEGVTGTLKIHDQANDRTIVMDNQKGWTDTVLWNPYGDESQAYKTLVCVESALVKHPVVVEAGKTWSSSVRISLE
jgi:glucose-6-phosphate 1-epimerase